MCKQSTSDVVLLGSSLKDLPPHRHNVDVPLVDVDVFSYPMFVIY